MADGLSSQIIELRAGGSDDPDGMRAAAVFTAYVALQHAQTFRRLLWPRLAIIAAVAWLLEISAVVPRTALPISLVLCASIGLGSLMLERRMNKRLQRLRDAGPNSANVV